MRWVMEERHWEERRKRGQGLIRSPPIYHMAATAPRTTAKAPLETRREEAPLVDEEVELAAELDPVLVAEVAAEPERDEADPELLAPVAAALDPEAVVEAAEEVVAAPDDCSAGEGVSSERVANKTKNHSPGSQGQRQGRGQRTGRSRSWTKRGREESKGGLK